MWIDTLDRNTFIKNIYSNLPELSTVEIKRIEVKDKGNRVTIVFDMPEFPDKIPLKWKLNHYNILQIEIDLFCVKEYNLGFNSNWKNSKIQISKNDCDNVVFEIMGRMVGLIEAEAGIIQSIEGYIGEK